jgi:hypothetical protein
MPVINNGKEGLELFFHMCGVFSRKGNGLWLKALSLFQKLYQCIFDFLFKILLFFSLKCKKCEEAKFRQYIFFLSGM